jgi:hypothetical protein
MYVNNLSTTQLLLSEKPCIVNGQFDKFETLLFLPPNQDRIAEGGLRKKGNFKHSYKYIVSNDCLSASRNSSFEASEDKNKSTAGVLYSSVTATAYDNTDYAESKKNKIDLNYKTDSGKWYICDTDGNPVKPAPMEIQEKIEGYIQSLQDNINCYVEESTDKNEDALQRPITFLPLITVVTVVFNGVKTLEETIKSIINQTYPNVEYIIIDGGSTDGTLDIIKKYEDAIDYWVSESDKGIYDAMNKGIKLAVGMWINFMNSGDKLYNKNTVKIVSGFLKADLVYGNNIKFDELSNQKFYNDIKKYAYNWNPKYCHQSLFEKRQLYKRYPFELKFEYGADFNQYLDCYYNGASRLYIPYTISIYLIGGLSSRQNYYLSLRETYYIILKYRRIYAKYYFIFRFFKKKIINFVNIFLKDKIL